MSTTLDTTALYGNRPAQGELQQRARERMTLATYNDARHGRFQTVLWSIISIIQLVVIMTALGVPEVVSDLEANPSYVFGLAIWVIGDLIFLAFAPGLYNRHQATMDRLEGKTIRRR